VSVSDRPHQLQAGALCCNCRTPALSHMSRRSIIIAAPPESLRFFQARFEGVSGQRLRLMASEKRGIVPRFLIARN
jgi:hypothetical protein